MTTSPTPLTDRIAALPDEQAITGLTLVPQGHFIDPFTQDEQQPISAKRSANPRSPTRFNPTRLPVTVILPARRSVISADTDSATAGLVEHAISVAPTTQRDPILILGVGALVLMAFHADIDLQRKPDKGWTFRFRSKALTDATIGKLLSQLLGNFIHPGK
jgi:hypothetical protein